MVLLLSLSISIIYGLNLHHLILPSEISSKISLEHYVYRGK